MSIADPAGVSVDRSGRLYVFDWATLRVQVFSSDGEALATIAGIGCCIVGERDPVLVTTDDEIYLIGYWRRELVADRDADDTRGVGILPIGFEGPRGPAIMRPDLPDATNMMSAEGGGLARYEPAPFEPRPVVGYAPTGQMLAGFSDDYRFAVHHPDGHRTDVERRLDPVSVTAAEAADARRGATVYMRQRDPEWQWSVAQLGDTKPAFFALTGAVGGGAWVLREGAGTPIEGCDPDSQVVTQQDLTPCIEARQIVDAFEPSGRYLGEVELPDGFALAAAPLDRRRDGRGRGRRRNRDDHGEALPAQAYREKTHGEAHVDGSERPGDCSPRSAACSLCWTGACDGRNVGRRVWPAGVGLGGGGRMGVGKHVPRDAHRRDWGIRRAAAGRARLPTITSFSAAAPSTPRTQLRTTTMCGLASRAVGSVAETSRLTMRKRPVPG